MRSVFIAFALVISGMSGNLQAARGHEHHPAVAKKGKTSVRPGARQRVAKAPLRRLPAGALPGAQPRAAAPGAESPVTPLPTTPALGPTSLVHLERFLPAVGLSPAPAAGPVPEPVSAAPGSAAAPSLASLRKVLPDFEDADDPLAQLVPGAPSGEFEAADRAHLDLLWPVETRTISSGWGPRVRSMVVRVRTARKARTVKRRFLGSHKGVDLSAPMGTDIYAAMDGQVIAAGRHKDYGNFVVLEHGNGVVTLYAHCNRNFVEDGEVVRRGQKIAEVGRTGKATGPHLHFELRLDGLPSNPLPWMNDVEEIPSELMAQNQAAVPPAARH
jgi:murein DD-endopeptidase MepM/ murein hydrolase activator NlpD